jgi:hypothetical protein
MDEPRLEIVIDRIDTGPPELTEQLPIHAKLLRILPGSDRPDYSLAVAHEPIRFRSTAADLTGTGIDLAKTDPARFRVNPDGTVDALIFGLVLCARLVGQTINLSMHDLPINIAYVIDDSQLGDPGVVFTKCHFAAVGFASTVG